jgi:hypothetical protein
MSKIKAGRIIRIENNDIKSNESEFYNRIYVEDENGKNERPIFLTDAELKRIDKRTDKNKEDWGVKGWFTDLLD